MTAYITYPNNIAKPIIADDISAVYFADPALNNQFVIHMPDDSMSGTIEAGEQLLVKKHSGNLWDAIYFYELDGRYFVKRLQRMKSKLIIISDNKHYENWEASPKIKDRMNILGMVTARCQIHVLG
jgi:phage repressor protein C with HTH and peptisase S24 domain